MRYLALGPAAMGIYAQIGWLKRREESLRETKEISGSSAGAVLAVMLALGFTVDDIMKKALEIDTGDLVRVSIRSFVSKYGFVDTSRLRAKLLEVMGSSPTFQELDMKLYIAAYCLNTGRTEYFSRDTHPDMPVIDAVCMSFSIPILFSAIAHDGHLYCDGGTKECVPIEPFLGKRPDHVTAVMIKNDDFYQESVDNHVQFAEALIRSALNNRANHCTPLMHLHKIDCAGANVFDFKMSHDEKLSLIVRGLEHRQ